MNLDERSERREKTASGGPGRTLGESVHRTEAKRARFCLAGQRAPHSGLAFLLHTVWNPVPPLYLRLRTHPNEGLLAVPDF